MDERRGRRSAQAGGRVGLRDIARLAGVSHVTVSRVLRAPEKVAAPTRARVERVVAAVGYIPNLVASALAADRTGMVAALIPTVDNAIHAESVQGLHVTLRAAGLHLLLGCTEFSLAEEEALVRAFLGRRAEAFYLTGITHSETTRRLLRAVGLPVVEVANLTDDPIDMVVGFSGRAAGQAAADYLLARGYRRLGYLFTPIGDNDRLRDRKAGFEQALARAGLALPAVRQVETELGFAGGAHGLARLLEREPAVEAVFCSTDVLAVGALCEARRRGIDVPGRLAVMGFDDLPIAAEIVPALTTVRVPRRAMGRRAGELIRERLAGREAGPRVVDMGFELIRRASA